MTLAKTAVRSIIVLLELEEVCEQIIEITRIGKMQLRVFMR